MIKNKDWLMLYDRKYHPSLGGASTSYTCPMHPEVQSVEPGNCTICGMVLVEKDKETDLNIFKHKRYSTSKNFFKSINIKKTIVWKLLFNHHISRPEQN